MAYRNRIVEYREVRAGDLRPDPRNWRKHPAAQEKHLRAMLERLGNLDVLRVRETPEGLVLVDSLRPAGRNLRHPGMRRQHYTAAGPPGRLLNLRKSP